MKTDKKQHEALSKDNWNQVEQEERDNFYGSAMHFFATNNILEVIEVLHAAKSEDKQLQDKIDRAATGLNSLWVRHHLHKNDLSAISDKIKTHHEEN